MTAVPALRAKLGTYWTSVIAAFDVAMTKVNSLALTALQLMSPRAESTYASATQSSLADEPWGFKATRLFRTSLRHAKGTMGWK